MGALQGIRVIDLSRAVPGPYCSMLLGDMGADVLLVEEARPPSGRRAADAATRRDAADVEREHAQNALRRNKRSIRLDLKHPEGQSIFRRLARAADVVLEGFRPGVVARLGVDYDTLRAENERLVYCSLSGFGQDGPYASMPGHDIDYIALGGALGLVGRPGTPPAIPANLIADLAGGGLMAAFGIVLALFARERTGRGQLVDAAMSDGVISLLTRAASQHFATGSVPRPGEDRITGAEPRYDVYECSDGKWLALGALEPWFYERLCLALELPEIAMVGEGAPAPERERVRDALRRRICERTRDEWFDRLRTAEACAAPVYSIDEVFADPHHRSRGMLVEIDHPRFGVLRQAGVAPKLADTPGEVRSAGPRPGEHTDRVLGELGYDAAAIAALRAATVVA